MESLTEQRHEFVLPAERPAATRARSLVGRDDELAQLEEAAAASTVAGRAVVIRGEAGIGKSALLHAALDRARGDHAIALGTCVEIEARRPFGAFVDVLHALSRTFGETEIERLVRMRAPELARLRYPQTGDLADHRAGQESGHRVHGSFLALIDALTRQRPLLIAIEDLHWSDEASWELFEFLARRARGRRLLLLGTCRPEWMAGHPLRDRLADLVGARVIDQITLAPIDIAATRELVATTLALTQRDSRAFIDFADLIHARCAGSPLFTEEMVRTLIEGGQLRLEGGAWRCTAADLARAMPESVVDSVRGRLARLSPDVQRAVAIASLIGEVLDVDLLGALLQVSGLTLAASVRAALDAQILAEPRDGTIRFRHALIREAASLTLISSERRSAHLRIAELLAARPVPANEEIAYHFYEAGERERARPFYAAAALDAQRAIALPHAARLAQRWLELTAQDDPDRADLCERLSWWLYALGRYDEAFTAGVAAARAAEASGDDVRLARGLLAAAQAAQTTAARGEEGRATARDMLARAESILAPLGPSMDLAGVHIVRTWIALGRLDEYGVHDLEVALSEAEHATTIIQATTPAADGVERDRYWTIFGTATGMLNAVLARHGRWEEAVAWGRQAHAAARTSRYPWLRHGALGNLITALVGSGGDPPELVALKTEQRELRRTHGVQTWGFLGTELRDLLHAGEWDAFLALCAEEAADIRDTPSVDVLRAAVCVGRVGPQPMLPRLAELRRAVRGKGGEATVAFWSAIALLFAGEPAGALEYAAHDFDEKRLSWGEPSPSAQASWVGCVAARKIGRVAASRELAALAVSTGPLRSLWLPPFQSAQRAVVRGASARLDGDLNGAIEAHTEAIARGAVGSCVNLRSLWIEHLLRLERAEWLTERGAAGDAAAAQADVDVVLDHWQKAKATWFLKTLRSWAEERGLRGPALATPTRLARSPLTQRETEVARLVARGLTNREIAAELTLSVRTVESHVERTLSKLAFGTRAQIAAWVVERYGASAS